MIDRSIDLAIYRSISPSPSPSLSYPILSISSYLSVLSYPILSFPMLFYAILSFPILIILSIHLYFIVKYLYVLFATNPYQSTACIHPVTSAFLLIIYLFIYLSIYLFIYLSISIDLSIYRSIDLSIY